MAAVFAYSYNNKYRDIYMDPVKAYRQLEKIGRSTLHDFIQRGAIVVEAGNLVALNLSGDGPGGLLMCGTTTELQDALRNLPLADPRPVAVYSVGMPGSLFARYARILAPGSTRTKTLISIGPLKTWWQVDAVEDFGKDKKWKNLSAESARSWRFDSLAEIAVPMARDKDKTAFITWWDFK